MIPGEWKRMAWMAAVPVPVIVAAFLLEGIGLPEGPLSSTELAIFKAAIDAHPFVPGALSLIAVLVVHVCVGLLVILLARRMIRASQPAWGLALGSTCAGLVTVVAIFWLSCFHWSIYHISYFVFEDIYRGTPVAGALLNPRFLSFNALSLAVFIPVCLGIVGLTMITAAGYERLRSLDEVPPVRSETFEDELRTANGTLRRCLYLVSTGLVTSTVAASIFFHLPTKLARADFAGGTPALSLTFDAISQAGAAGVVANRVATKDALEAIGLRDKLRAAQQAELAHINAKFDQFAAELSIFWGAVFALTLVAAVGLPLLTLQQKVRDYSDRLTDSAQAKEARARLAETGTLTQSGFDQFKFVLALIAPLATGPIASFVQAAAAP